MLVRQIHAGQLPAIAAVACGYLVLNTAPVLVGVFISAAHLTESTAASLVTAEWLATSLTSLALSFVLRCPPIRKLGVSGLLVAAMAQAAAIGSVRMASTLPLLIFGLRICAGVGEGMLLYAANSAIGLVLDPVRPYALAMVLGSLWSAALLLVTPALQANWPPAVFALLALSLFLATFVVRSLPTSETARNHSSSRPHELQGVASALSFSLVAVLLANVALGALWAFSEVAGTRLGISRAAADQILALNLAAGLAGGMVAAWLNARLDYRVSLVASMSCLVVAAIALCSAVRPSIYVAAQLLYGAMYPISVTFLMAAVARLAANLLPAAGGVALIGLSLGPAAGGLVVMSAGIPALGLSVGLALVASVGSMLLAFSKSPLAEK